MRLEVTAWVNLHSRNAHNAARALHFPILQGYELNITSSINDLIDAGEIVFDMINLKQTKWNQLIILTKL